MRISANECIGCINSGLVLAILLIVAAPCHAVSVSSVSALNEAITSANNGGDSEIVLEPGTYTLTQLLQVTASNVTVRGVTGSWLDVIVQGQGMQGSIPHGFLVYGNNFTVKDLTIRLVANHGLQLQPGADGLHVKNVRFQDTYEQMLKGAWDDSDPSTTCDDGLVEDSLFQYTAGIGPQWYIGGIDVHAGKNWIVRNNVFRGIRSPSNAVAEHAVHFWSDAENTLVERNLIINCDRGVGFGLGSRGHIGGIIRNNMIYHNTSEGFADVGIQLESSPNSEVYNNTVFQEHSYQNAIEYRFAATTNVLIVNNLTNKSISSRDGGTGTVQNNVTDASLNWFTGATSGNLHLASAVSTVVDMGQDVAGLSVDFDNAPRPAGDGVDIGAHEWNALSVPVLGEMGMILCAMLLMAAGAYCLRRRG